MAGVRPVREVSPWTLGSGVTLREMVQFPPWLIFLYRLILIFCSGLLWCVRHWVVCSAVVLGLWWWLWSGWWQLGVLGVLLVPAGFWFGRVALLLQVSEATSVRAVLRGLRRCSHVRRLWQPTLFQLNVTARGDGESVPPLENMLPTDTGVVATVVTGAVALNSVKLVKFEPELASGLFCDRVTVRSLTPSLASVRFEWGQHLRQVYRLGDLPGGEPVSADKPAKIRFGVRADGSAASIVSNLSTLIGGASGAGKSSTMWSVIAGYMETVPVRLRIIDPSGVEFAELGRQLGKGLVHDYVADENLPGARKLADFWEDLTEAFNRRMVAVNQSGDRWHVPTDKEPLDILIIDEILPLAAQLRKESTDHIVGRICYLGRKAGFVVIAASQAAQVDAIGRIRDLFPQRICHRTMSRYLTDAFLGEGAESDGARCSQLDAEHDQGVSYMAAEGVRGYTALRSAWVPDTETKLIAQRQRPTSEANIGLRNKPTAMYQMRNADSEIIYIGIAEANRIEDRWSEHARTKKWWREVHGTPSVVATFPDRDTAETAEALAIKKHRPRYNVQHNGRKHYAQR